jgi:hypothetical protein
VLQIDVSVSQWKERATEAALARATGKAIHEAGHFVTAEAKLRAPISPKQSQVKTKTASHRFSGGTLSVTTTANTARVTVGYTSFSTTALGKRYAGGKTTGKRKFSYTRQKKNPGGLTRSIRVEFQGDEAAHVFVPTNSEAGKYARYIHDQRYIKWRNLGPGSVAKASGGKPVGEKFIERAYSENLDKVREIFDRHIERALGGPGAQGTT